MGKEAGDWRVLEAVTYSSYTKTLLIFILETIILNHLQVDEKSRTKGKGKNQKRRKDKQFMAIDLEAERKQDSELNN